MRGPLNRYRALVKKGALTPDPAQEAATEKLQALHDALRGYRGLRRGLFGRRRAAPRGLYLWGGVGRGKTLLMDLFFNNTQTEPKRRVHFHAFMSETHDRLAAWRSADEKTRRRHPAFDRKNPDDPIPYAARDIAQEAMVLCFDEFQVSDIADAMILGRLFEALFAEGVVIVATSNRHPDALYKDGLNRQLFLPFIDLLKRKIDIYHLEAAEDYRLSRLGRAPVYYQPLGPGADAAMDAAWSQYICGAQEKAEVLRVKGRDLDAPRTARGAARFSFAALCEAPLGANDYLALVRQYSTLFIDHIPLMSAEKRNEAKRFVTLIDAIYDSRTKLVCSADGEPADLYPAGDGSFEFERTASRLMEMRSDDYLSAEHEVLEDV
ncbi:MAG: cell division protein ZapE [Pseudomonadota bacterium]